MARSLFWLSEEALQPHLPRGKLGKPRVDDRKEKLFFRPRSRSHHDRMDLNEFPYLALSCHCEQPTEKTMPHVIVQFYSGRAEQ